jgi:ubiquinone/menaquinone biosynthesis C-methylase UbiE
LCCPGCRASRFTESPESLFCEACGESYALVDGKYPRMLHAAAAVSIEEIEVQDEVAAHYRDTRYSNPWSKKYHESWTELMVGGVKTTGQILDNGCGIGELHHRLPDADITALDISAEMVRIAGEKYERVLIGDSQRLPFEDGSFDLVMARSLLHHLPEPETGVREIGRVLRPGGRVVAIDTNSSLLSYLPRLIANRGEHFSEEHKNLRRKELLASFAGEFEIERVHFFGYLAYPILGFPDLVDLFKYVPLKRFSYGALMGIDGILSRIPLVRSQAWGLLVQARKK